MINYALELQDITKTFPGVRALDSVSFNCIAGETHALVGENGAGKSTLINIIAGVMEPDRHSGAIQIFGKDVKLKNPAEAQRLGISVIYQEFNLLPWLTVAENIFLGRLPTNKLGNINWKQVNDDAKEPLNLLGMPIDPQRKVIDLSIAEQQIVEIAKALSMRSKIIIMDEPSAVLAGEELENLFKVLRTLKKQGITVVYISHRLDEVFEIADRATVLKDGKTMGTLDIKEADKSTLINLMIGRSLEETFPSAKNSRGEPVLVARNISSGKKLRNISFELHKGEILGLAGLMGGGQTDLACTLFGIDKLASGEIIIDGKVVRSLDPQTAVDLGIGLVPEDRKTQGLVLSLSIRNNIALPIIDTLTRGGFIDNRKETALVNKYIELLEIKATNIDKEVQQLSGGNQQKVVLAKWLSTHPKVIILDEPTRGIDVGTKMEMYHIMRNLAEQGTGIIMISSELLEILGMSDRILVMRDGTIAGELSPDEATEEKILRLAIGE
jgi:ribose transport system ATP-binding protein